jgi:uncharacterized protein
MGVGATDGEEDLHSVSPMRLCAVSRKPAERDYLIRFVAGPDGSIVPDLACRLPGRGVWVGATRALVEAAVRQKAFSRSLKQQLTVPEDLPARIDRLMVRRLAEAVSIANKAGLLIAGFAKVDALISEGRAAVLLHAADGAPGGALKLDRKYRALVGAEQAENTVVNELTGSELDLAIGRSNVVHAAASEGGASRRVLQEALRLRRYRSGDALKTTNSSTGSA